MALIKYLLPVVVPLPFSGYFDIFDGVIQAYVFCVPHIIIYKRGGRISIKATGRW